MMIMMFSHIPPSFPVALPEPAGISSGRDRAGRAGGSEGGRAGGGEGGREGEREGGREREREGGRERGRQGGRGIDDETHGEREICTDARANS